MNNQIADVLDQAVDLSETALQENANLQAKVADLQSQLDKVVLEKVAAEKRPAFSDAAMTAALLRLEELQVIRPDGHTKIAAELKKNPDAVFALLTKVANVLTSAPSDGSGIAKEASSAAQGDPDDQDGWLAFSQGRQVVLKP